uniref:hypothetical protein n=1 Tax=Bradyrhizobium sp. (strain ORS 278) TaxID=114615 RepID=UPI0005A197B7|nr:hypothetical protein [Bradyrhizobium sp. ORS 278]
MARIRSVALAAVTAAEAIFLTTGRADASQFIDRFFSASSLQQHHGLQVERRAIRRNHATARIAAVAEHPKCDNLERSVPFLQLIGIGF